MKSLVISATLVTAVFWLLHYSLTGYKSTLGERISGGIRKLQEKTRECD